MLSLIRASRYSVVRLSSTGAFEEFDKKHREQLIGLSKKVETMKHDVRELITYMENRPKRTTWDDKYGVYYNWVLYRDFDMTIPDINDEQLFSLGQSAGTPHLSPATFPSPAFPVPGSVIGSKRRLMVPLVCQMDYNTGSEPINIWFLVNTGSPHTCLSLKSVEALYTDKKVFKERYSGPGTENNYLYLRIQDPSLVIEGHVSKSNFQHVNILGADALEKLKLSVLVDWKNNKVKLDRLRS
uniref:TNase-like domain-containing protein n=1 Tax=Caenorhabditis tropicalis TaxID=1561998 RepID=A0A1I7UHD7_9PELO